MTLYGNNTSSVEVIGKDTGMFELTRPLLNSDPDRVRKYNNGNKSGFMN